MTPDISILVPVYKAEPWLPQCVDSILAQTLGSFELLLVDDGSPDGCPAICDEYAKRDSRVRVLHKENGGVSSAVAAGIAAAKAPYVGFVDSDDWVDPGFYEELYRSIREQDADLVEGELVIERSAPGGETRKTLRTGTRVYEGPEAIARLTDQYMTSFLYDNGAPDRPLSYFRLDKLFRRRLLTDALPFYDQRLSLGEDAVLLAAAVPACGKAVTLSCAARYHHRVLSGSVSHQAGEDQMARIGLVHQALMKIADSGRPLDRTAAAAFVGSMVHARIYRTAERPDLGPGEKCRRMKDMLRQAPTGTLEAFVRLRGDRSLGVFYGLLRLGLTAPCVWMARLHSGLQRRG